MNGRRDIRCGARKRESEREKQMGDLSHACQHPSVAGEQRRNMRSGGSSPFAPILHQDPATSLHCIRVAVKERSKDKERKARLQIMMQVQPLTEGAVIVTTTSTTPTASRFDTRIPRLERRLDTHS